MIGSGVVRCVRDNLDYLYLLRVPICTWAFVGLLGAASNWKLTRPLLKNLFDVNNDEAFWVGLFAVAACFAAFAAARSICAGAPERFRHGNAGPHVGILTAPVLVCLPFLALWRHLDAPGAFYAFVISLVANSVLYLLAARLSDFRVPSLRFFPGYSERVQGTEGPVYRREHLMCLAMMAVYFVVFCVVSAYRQRTLFAHGLASSANNGPPTLAFLFAAAAFLCLGLSALTFLLDRYRIPLTLLVVVLLLITDWSGNGEHVFPVFTPKENRLSAAQILAAPGKVILVAASGGGIQASAWTARVLTGLAADPRFSPSVRVISAVSGGSLGALCYARTFSAAAARPAVKQWTREEALRASMTPSLDAIAYGIVRYDLLRVFFLEPNNEFDRGWTLENTIAARSDLDSTSLSDWAAHTGKGMPAFIFNATAMETGEPVVFSTTKMPQASGIVDFAAKEDLAVATAVRLSATFPFVSPAARPGDGAISPHIGDGGYYDNSGMENLVAWFEEGGFASQVPVLLIRISAFPPDNPPNPQRQSWIYDMWSPLDALMGVRTSGQSIHGRSDLKRLQDNKRIEYVEFQYSPSDRNCAQPSLSWNMDAGERSCIDKAWVEQKAQQEKVSKFLN